MKTKSYTIRLEKTSDERTVENMVRESFWNVYRPGAYEHFLLHVLRKDPAFVHELDFVMETDGSIIGQTAFVRSAVTLDDGRSLPTLTLGPVCIANAFKRQGYGKDLLNFAFEKAKTMGFGAVLFEGNLDFYRHCGCVAASTYGVRYQGLPEGEDSSFFLCRELQKGYFEGGGGEYTVPEVYFVSKDEMETFDKGFSSKEKLKLPGQLFED